MATLQVRSIEDDLYKALGHKALMDNRSISQEVVSIIKAHLANTKPSLNSASNTFIEMCGTWEDKRSAEDITKEIHSARHSRDRSKGMF